MKLGPTPKMEWHVCPTCGESFLTGLHHVCPPRYEVWLQEDQGFGTEVETKKNIYTHDGPERAAEEYTKLWDSLNFYSMAKREAYVQVMVRDFSTGKVNCFEIFGNMEPRYIAAPLLPYLPIQIPIDK